MKTTRRQELRTNRLSQQIEEIGNYVKKNAVKLVVILVVVAAGIAGGYWVVHQREQRLMDGWATLSRTAVLADAGSPISVFESLARQDLQPALTAEALLKVGDAAATKLMNVDVSRVDATGNGPTDKTDWAVKAENAYAEVVKRFPNDLTASGKAMVLLGVLAEDKGNMEKAREWYQKVINNKRLAGTPFFEQATYRLARLERWSKPVVFPPPMQTVPQPPTTEDQAVPVNG